LPFREHGEVHGEGRMGMHVGLVASRTSVMELRRAFVEVFPELEPVESAEFPTADDLWQWMDAHRVFVSAHHWRPDNRGRDVVAFWQDGPWAVFADGSYVLPSDAERLALLSTHFPVVLSFIVESASGTAEFARFEDGKCRRKIMNADGDVTVEGAPLPEEAGIAVADYYMEESDRLARALGLSSLEYRDGVSTWKDMSAVSVVDQTDYSSQPGAPSAVAGSGDAVKTRKPWWRFW
jgi:hypothetical protein